MGGYHGVESDGGETTFGLHRVRHSHYNQPSHPLSKELLPCPGISAISDIHGCFGALRALLPWSNRATTMSSSPLGD